MKSTISAVCLTENEFKLLLRVYAISQVVCFETKGDISEEANDYFTLYKKGYIENSNDALEPSENVSEIFSMLKECKHYINYNSPDPEKSNYVFGISEYPYIVMMEPGSRKGEYVKLRSIPKDSFKEELEAVGILRVPDLPDFVDEETTKEDKIHSVIGTFSVLSVNTGKELGTVSIVQKGVGERIMVHPKDGSTVFQKYTVDGVVTEIEKLMEINE